MSYPSDPIECMRVCWSEPIAKGAYHFDDVAHMKKHGKPAPAPAAEPDPEDLI